MISRWQDSLVIRNNSRFRKKTRQKLQEIIKEEKHHIELLQYFENEESEGKGD